jgi:L-malate glycosyltransferase
MKHILSVLPYMELGGTERQAFSLMQNLRQSYHISLLAPDGSGSRPFREANFSYDEFPRLESHLFGGLRQFRAAITAINRRKSIDLIHVHAAHELSLLAKFCLPKVPIVFTVHGYHGKQSQIGYFLAARLSNWCVDRVIVLCQSDWLNLVRFGLKSAKIRTIYNGVAKPEVDGKLSQELRERFHLDPNHQIILGTVARLTEAKGLSYLIQAVARLVNLYPQIKLVIIGEGELKADLQQLVAELNITDKTIFTGYLHRPQDLMSVFDIFVLPSLQEAMPLAILEAMALGKPVIGTKVGGIPEQIVDGETGYLVPAKDIAALVDCLHRLIVNPELADSFGRRGYARYQEKFALSRSIEQTVDTYTEILAQS